MDVDLQVYLYYNHWSIVVHWRIVGSWDYKKEIKRDQVSLGVILKKDVKNIAKVDDNFIRCHFVGATVLYKNISLQDLSIDHRKDLLDEENYYDEIEEVY